MQFMHMHMCRHKWRWQLHFFANGAKLCGHYQGERLQWRDREDKGEREHKGNNTTPERARGRKEYRKWNGLGLGRRQVEDEREKREG